MGKLVVPVSFRREIKSFCKRSLSQVHPEYVKTFQKYVKKTISVQHPRDSVKSSNTVNNKRTNYAVTFLKRTFRRFVSKTFPNDSE